MVRPEEPRLEEGMMVEDTAGNELGHVTETLAPSPQEPVRFFAVGERLVPLEAVRDVVGGRLVLNVDAERLFDLPEHHKGEGLTREKMDQARRALTT